MYKKKPAAAILLGLAAPFSLFFVSLRLASSQSSPTDAAAREREATAQKFVDRDTRLWQQRLNLNDWNIKVQLRHADELEPKTLGNIHWDLHSKTATIAVLSSYDYTLPQHEMLDDMEFTIVHEMVHLHLAALPHTASSRTTEEYAVNQLARALIDLEKQAHVALSD